eukprot:CAMPEP_0172054800 /NCGR_PEP_ID=MMETSP1043-20130122/4939_1 /TAXON_ID=464988 /ORGANISM="Hemiselmis andersenii, Strain CCMP441" /LENGTH=300 /DNA_ID=CAMNT_0012714153 /DNA_START=98 /DNA_END=997 /DNA_ORIENTATION=+
MPGRQQREDLVPGLRNTAKGAMSKLARAGRRAGSEFTSRLSQTLRIGSPSRSYGSAEQRPAAASPSDRVCASAPHTRDVTRASSPGRHTIHCSPDDKAAFFEALDMQINSALWNNKQMVLDRLLAARKAMVEADSDLPPEDLRNALLSVMNGTVGGANQAATRGHAGGGPSGKRQQRHSSDWDAVHSGAGDVGGFRTPQNDSDSLLSRGSTPLVSDVVRTLLLSPSNPSDSKHMRRQAPLAGSAGEHRDFAQLLLAEPTPPSSLQPQRRARPERFQAGSFTSSSRRSSVFKTSPRSNGKL